MYQGYFHVNIRKHFLTLWATEHIAQSGCGVSMLGDVQKLPGRGPAQIAVGGPTWGDKSVTSGGPIWPQPFFASVKLFNDKRKQVFKDTTLLKDFITKWGLEKRHEENPHDLIFQINAYRLDVVLKLRGIFQLFWFLIRSLARSDSLQSIRYTIHLFQPSYMQFVYFPMLLHFPIIVQFLFSRDLAYPK